MGEALAWARARLAGTDEVERTARMLLAHVQGCALSELFAYPDRLLAPAAVVAYRALIERRAQHEPVAYLVGQRAFLDLDLLVDPRVLIPRPETELLVERALSWVRRWGTPRIADVGTGSGAIAVSLALALQRAELPLAQLPEAELPQAAIYALDSSPGALAVARQNAVRHGVADRITFLQGDLLDPLRDPVDLIVANLPYVTEDEYAALPPGIRDYEPRAALVAGPDGLDAIRRLLRTARPHLALDANRAAMLLEIGAAQGAAVSALAAAAFPDARVEVIPDYGGRDRVVEIEIDKLHRDT